MAFTSEDARGKTLSEQVSLASMLLTMDQACQDIAIATVKEVLDVQEAHPGALMQLALIQKEKGEIREATKLFVRLLIRDKDSHALKCGSPLHRSLTLYPVLLHE